MTRITTAAERMHAYGHSRDLMRRHSEPWRAYHVWEHPLEIIGHFQQAEIDGVDIEDPDACVAFAGWHDAVYDPEAAHGRNEELSARLCGGQAVGSFSHQSVTRACFGIRATITHRPVPTWQCPDIGLKLDADLAILGADRERFDRYDADIAFEYSYVPKEDYDARRAGVLKRFLDRDRLYLTEWGRDRWETKARANLIRTITKLEETRP